jgi:hypothetical protein
VLQECCTSGTVDLRYSDLKLECYSSVTLVLLKWEGVLCKCCGSAGGVLQ